MRAEVPPTMNQPSAPPSPPPGRRRSLPLVQRARRTRPGAPPGTLVGDPAAEPTVIDLVRYGPDHCTETHACTLPALAAERDAGGVVWVDVSGLADVAAIRAIGERFGLHALALEDIVNVHQRAKVERYGDHLFIVARIADTARPDGLEQFSMCLGHDFLLTFQEHAGDGFGPVRERLRQSGRVRAAGPDYLCYALLDAAVDGFYPVLERVGERLATLEDAVIALPEPAHIDALHAIKRELLELRRAVWPLRDMFNALIRDDTPFIEDATRIYLRDCHDHAIQLVDIIETYREIASGLLDVYLSSVSARMTEVMKVLTIIATIFIPLSFVASLYGMNFDGDVSRWNMPELEWRYGYPFALLLMSGIAVGLVAWFWRRGWIGRPRRR
jgi:magnesium transporter